MCHAGPSKRSGGSTLSDPRLSPYVYARVDGAASVIKVWENRPEVNRIESSREFISGSLAAVKISGQNAQAAVLFAGEEFSREVHVIAIILMDCFL